MRWTLNSWAIMKENLSTYQQTHSQMAQGEESRGLASGLTPLLIFILTKFSGTIIRLRNNNLHHTLSLFVCIYVKNVLIQTFKMPKNPKNKQ